MLIMKLFLLYLLVCTVGKCKADSVLHNLVNRHGDNEKEVVSERGGCSYRVSWQIQGEDINFLLRTAAPSPRAPLWIAVGLSATQSMPDTTFVSCWSNSDQTLIQLKSGHTVYYNGISIYDSDQSNNISLLGGRWMDDELYCNFSWRPSMSDAKYLILASGLLSEDGKSMLKHTNRPSVSPWQHEDNGNGEFGMNCNCNSKWKLALIRIHGALMGLAFLLLFPIGIITARYYRSTFSPNLWFKVHSRLMVMAVCSVILALVLALVHTNGTLHVGIHQIFGIVVIIFVLLQPLVALCRPHADPLNFWRKLFNRFHRTLGISVFTAGVIQCFLGVYILMVQIKGILYSFLVLSVIGHGIFTVFYEYIHFRLSRRVTVAHYSKVTMEDDNSDEEEVDFVDTTSSSTRPKTPTTNTSLQPSLQMNPVYYMYILQAFTITGLFNAFLFYEIS